MIITARFPSTCPTCGRRIEQDTKIEWTKGQPAQHLECAQGETESTSTDAPSFAPTTEQTRALELFGTGENLAIEAGAGTGKTSTLLLLAQATERKGQYVAFNRAIVQEASAKFPANVSCSTAHSLAFKAIGRKYAHRLQSPRMRSLDVANRMGIEAIVVQDPAGRAHQVSASFLGGYVLQTVTRFCQSADPEPNVRHAPYIEGIDEMGDYTNNRMIAAAMLPFVHRAWEDLQAEHGWLPYRHDHYLKTWQLSDPKIRADFILFDEAQDANPVMVAIVAAQTHAQLVWVGDSQQQIYSFTGAINALANVPADSRAFLTQSFRFGPAIAEEANSVLERLPEAELRLVGTETIPSTVAPVREPRAILTRTNATAVREVLRYQASGKQASLVGGGKEVVSFAKGAQALMTTGKTDHPELACFNSWSEVTEYVQQDAQGGELRLLVKLVEDFTVPVILAALDRQISEREADVIVSTAHKSKGREWDTVQLAGDFPPDASGEELRLLYVAVTRAKLTLDISFLAAEGNCKDSVKVA